MYCRQGGGGDSRYEGKRILRDRFYAQPGHAPRTFSNS